ncbi:SDR family NAD(P)-dependent oxidoreductase [Streptomyces sp. NRRL F-5135]|uniref:SDR family NAD(P)-dependent oxidoreductase n=1 Tax=Streptomyces sp. NRRL F-5135 TaxID=1463858 RepID=UPI0004C86D96|nr:SDR family NAD(P)-dependent oxidoreductase [Streptomyces sp. NRRL F-5135]
MKTVVITGGTDGIGRGIARTYLGRGDRVVVVGTDKTKAEPGAWFLRADLELIDENRRLIDRLSAELDTIDVLVLGARFQRSQRTETADGLESNFALTYLSRFLLSHGLAGLLGRAADPVVLNFGGAGRFGPPRWDDLQQRTQYHGLTAMIQAGILNAALAVDFVGRHPAIRYVNNFPGTVATSFAGDYDQAEAAQIGRLRATGKPVETAVKEILPFLDSGTPGHPVAVSEGVAIPLDPQASSLADARRLYDHTREVLAR